MNDAKQGYTCTCGAFNEFNSYVYAHWSNVITADCKDCQKQAAIHRGKVIAIKNCVDAESVSNEAATALGL